MLGLHQALLLQRKQRLSLDRCLQQPKLRFVSGRKRTDMPNILHTPVISATPFSNAFDVIFLDLSDELCLMMAEENLNEGVGL